MDWFEHKEPVEPHLSNDALNTYVFQNIYGSLKFHSKESNLP